MIVIAGWIDVEPSCRDELVAASVPFQQSTRTDEPGCEGYVFAADAVVPGRICVFEQWATPEDLEAHFRHPNFSLMGELIHKYPRTGSQTLKYLVEATAPVRDAAGVATARF